MLKILMCRCLLPFPMLEISWGYWRWTFGVNQGRISLIWTLEIGFVKKKKKNYILFLKNETEKKGAIFEIRQFCCWTFWTGPPFSDAWIVCVGHKDKFYVWFAMQSLLEKALKLSCCWPSCSIRRCRKMNPRGQKGV